MSSIGLPRLPRALSESYTSNLLISKKIAVVFPVCYCWRYINNSAGSRQRRRLPLYQNVQPFLQINNKHSVSPSQQTCQLLRCPRGEFNAVDDKVKMARKPEMIDKCVKAKSNRQGEPGKVTDEMKIYKKDVDKVEGKPFCTIKHTYI